MKTKRLTEGGTDFEREVLASARLDQGPKGGLKRTLVALGVSAGAIPSSAASASAGVGLGAGATTGSGLASAAVVAKWLGVAILVAAGSGGSLKRCQPLPGLSTASCGAGASAPPSVRDTRAMPRCVGSVLANS